MMIIYSILAAVIPISIYLFLIWKLDKFEPEPLSLLLKYFLFGAFGATSISLIISLIVYNSFSVNNFTDLQIDIITNAIGPAIIEEFAKGIFLIFIFRNKQFDNFTDGLVYGGAIGLGFAMSENFLYYFSESHFNSWIYLVLIRTVFTSLMHCISTAILGATFAKVKFSNFKGKFIFALLGIFSAISIHFYWNVRLTLDYNFFATLLYMFLVIVFYFLIFNLSVKEERKIIFKYLKNESFINILNFNILQIISSKKTWDNKYRKHLNKTQINIIELATKLAFRKFQSNHSNAKRKKNYENDIHKIKNKINTLINNSETDNENY